MNPVTFDLLAHRMSATVLTDELGRRVTASLCSVHAGRRMDALAEQTARVATFAAEAAVALGQTAALDTTPIAVRVQRIYEAGPDGLRIPSRSGGGNPPPGQAEPVVDTDPPRVAGLRARARALHAAGHPIIARAQSLKLPAIVNADRTELDRWEALILDLEVEHTDSGRPFTEEAVA